MSWCLIWNLRHGRLDGPTLAGSGEFTELVQIGTGKLDTESRNEIDSRNLLVRPRSNPGLSDYLQTLTGITNARLVDEGIDFDEAYRHFVRFADGGMIVAFGRDDLIFETNIDLYGIKNAPLMPNYVNVTPWLREHGVEPKGYHACDVAKLCGATYVAREHDALDDARSVALGARTLIAKGARNLFLPHDMRGTG